MTTTPTNYTRGINLIRLVSGEELIGSISVNPETGDIEITKPAIVIVQPPRSEKEQMGIALIGWLPYSKVAKTGVIIKAAHVLFILEPDDSMVKTYKERFTSDFIFAPQPDVRRASGLVIPGSSS